MLQGLGRFVALVWMTIVACGALLFADSDDSAPATDEPADDLA